MKRIVPWFKRLLVSFSVVAMAACGGGGGGGNDAPVGESSPVQPAPAPAPAARGQLLAGEELSTLPLAALNSILFSTGLSGMTLQYDVVAHRVTYRTVDAAGNPVDASGLVIVPEKPAGVQSALLSFQHGTVTREAEAPSNFGVEGETGVGAVLASLGYVVAMPDYLGYGASRGRVHPYLHAASLAPAIVDMLRATRALLAQQSTPTDGRLFLAGYSEGGYGTLAAHKAIEEQHAGEFSITAVMPGAGPYDLANTLRTLLAQPTLAQPAFIGFLFKAYDVLYNGAASRLAQYFQPPYDSVVNTSYDGSKDTGEIAASLTSDISRLFQPVFLQSIRAGGEVDFAARLAQNDIYNWAPKAPLRFFHGDEDEVVPYANMITAVQQMQSNGAPQVTRLDCIGVAPRNHANCYAPYVLSMVTYFADVGGAVN